MNTLYYGDNLEVLRKHVADESVDLIYLDPPFNSARDYNVLFKQAKKDENQAQITAFTDTWQWSKRRYEEFFEDPRNSRLFDLMESLHRILGASEMMAYLVMMAPRLLDLHRVLKPTGSLYLHCDPTACHQLRMLLDSIFGPTRFVNEIIWKRTTAHSDAKQGSMHFGRLHDIILLYTKTELRSWNQPYTAHDEAYVRGHYPYVEQETGRRYGLWDITGPGGAAKGNPRYEIFGVTKYWRYSQSNMMDKIEQGRVVQASPGAVPREKRYLDESAGVPVGTLWTDIPPINSQAAERMGYPTQKPLGLLERIIAASSNPGDLVLDPFCGCGTAVVAAEKLGRRWIGIDITFIAIDLMVSRLAKDFGLKRGEDYAVLGDPKDAHSARKLFEESPKQFEVWAIGLVAGVPQPEKSADKGVDGKVYFMDLEGKLQWAVCQVKGGHLTPSAVRDLEAVITRDKAALGFFLCLETPTKGMYQEAEELGFFDSPSGRKIPRLQIHTIKELLEGNEFDFPRGYSLRSGGKKLQREGEQRELKM